MIVPDLNLLIYACKPVEGEGIFACLSKGSLEMGIDRVGVSWDNRA